MNSVKHFYRTKDNIRQPLGITLTRPDGSVVDLSSLADANIKFHMVDTADLADKVAETAANATIVGDGTAGQVQYDLQAADVDTVGTYAFWFIIDASSEQEHFPADGRKCLLHINDPANAKQYGI